MRWNDFFFGATIVDVDARRLGALALTCQSGVWDWPSTTFRLLVIARREMELKKELWHVFVYSSIARTTVTVMKKY